MNAEQDNILVSALRECASAIERFMKHEDESVDDLIDLALAVVHARAALATVEAQS